MGWLQIKQADGTELGFDTFTCCHCNKPVVIKTQDPSTVGGFCIRCDKKTCPACHRRGICTPFMKRVEAAEDAAYHRQRRGY